MSRVGAEMTPFNIRQRVKDFFAKAASPSSPKGPSHSPPPVEPEAAPVRAAPSAPPVSSAPSASPAPPAASPAAASPAPVAATPAAPPTSAPAAPEAATSDAEKQKEEERQRKHWARVRKGMLKWLIAQGGTASMADMHGHSEAKFFVAHRAFSRLMEEYTEEGLVTYGGGNVEITSSGRDAAA